MNPRIVHETATIHDPAATMGAKVAAAAQLWQLVKDCQEALDVFKAEARVVALKDGRNTVTIDGDGLAQCKVVVPMPTLRLKEGLSVEGEKAALGPQFPALFDVKLELKKTDPTYIAAFPPEVQAHISNITTLVNNPPRVSLSILPGVEEVK
jgi:hypothetical protein